MEEKKYTVEYPVVHQVNDIDLSGTYSYAHYLNWKFEDRLELIKGKIFKMGSPSTTHQRIIGRIYVALFMFLKGHRCEAFIAPFDVRFPDGSLDDKAVFTVLQPDIAVICDQTKLDEKGCIGAPDIVVEVLSPGNSKKELINKFNIYQEFGVKEYWLVSPTSRSFIKYVLNLDGVYEAGLPYVGGEFVSDVLPGFRLNVEEVFGVLK